MNQYMFSVWHVEGEPQPSEEEMQQMAEDVNTFNAKIAAAGIEVYGAGLHPPATATVVDASKGGDVLMTDGPFAEAKEQLGGFWILEAPNLDAALALAAEASAACHAPIEVRPVHDDPAD